MKKINFEEFLKELGKMKGQFVFENNRIRHKTIKDQLGMMACPGCAWRPVSERDNRQPFKGLETIDFIEFHVIYAADAVDDRFKLIRSQILSAIGLPENEK